MGRIITDIVKYCTPGASPELIQTVFDVRKKRFRKAMVHIDPDILRTIQELHLQNKKTSMTAILTTQIIRDMWPESIPALSHSADYVISTFTELLKAY